MTKKTECEHDARCFHVFLDGSVGCAECGTRFVPESVARALLERAAQIAGDMICGDAPAFAAEIRALAKELTPPQTERAFGPCGNHKDHERKTIGIYPRDGETGDEAYARWARGNGRNPWCYHPLSECPEILTPPQTKEDSEI